jgi:selenocysteine lyase/cysteine desulfurase
MHAGVSIPVGMAMATALPDASAWALDPGLAYLNHGGFGATPVPVLAQQQAWREVMERNPVGLLVHQLPELLAGVRTQVAAFLGADQEGLAFVDNATTGMQTVIAQVRLAPGDEVVATDHCYPAVLAQLRRAAAAAGAVLRIAEVPLPAGDRMAVADAVLARLSRRTAPRRPAAPPPRRSAAPPLGRPAAPPLGRPAARPPARSAVIMVRRVTTEDRAGGHPPR